MFEYVLMFLALCSVGWLSRRNAGPMPIHSLPIDERGAGYNATSVGNR